ncbi:MAG: transposase zinc-binding domain-containing protein [Pseudomonadota bacterium]
MASSTDDAVPVGTRARPDFLCPSRARDRAGLARVCQRRVEALLECGTLANGFLRLRCTDCAHEKLMAFSCSEADFTPPAGHDV